MKLGGHACLFGDRIQTETDFILEHMRKANATGIEMGFRFFGDDVRPLEEALRKNQIMLSGFHCGAKFSDFSNTPEKTRTFMLNIGNAIKDMPHDVFPVKNLVLSGDYSCDPPRAQIESNSPLNDETFLIACARKLETIAQELSAMGVHLHYHNHNQEFERNGKIYRILKEYTHTLQFAFDIGWIAMGSGDVSGVLNVLNECKNRMSYVHLRDVSLRKKEFVPLGTGDFDYAQTLTLLHKILPTEGWAIVEYETGEQDFERYATALDFLQNVCYTN